MVNLWIIVRNLVVFCQFASSFCTAPIRSKGKNSGNIRQFRILNIKVPTDYLSAIKSDQSEHWNKAMLEEIGSIMANKAFELVKRKPEMKVLPLVWTYRIKTQPDNTILKYKARLVVKGCSQRPGIDFTDTFAPVVQFFFLINFRKGLSLDSSQKI